MNFTLFIVQLCMEEGVRLDVYSDSLGNLTVGVGHLVKKGSSLTHGDFISLVQCVDFLEEDMQTAYNDCLHLWSNFALFPDEVQLILCDMMLNMGMSRLSKFKKMRAFVTLQAWQNVADEMENSRWYMQVGIRATNLVQRMREVG